MISTLDPDLARSVINWPSGPGSGTAIQVYGDADPNPYPKETFTDPQHWISFLLGFLSLVAVACPVMPVYPICH